MNREEYISSGILELYVSGALTDDERRRVEEDLLSSAELRAAMREVEDTQEALLMAAAVSPPSGVRTSIMQRIDQGAYRPDRTLSLWKFAAAAAFAIAIISTYMAISFRLKLIEARSELQAMLYQHRQIAEDYNTVNKRLDHLDSNLMVMMDPRFARIVLNGTPQAPDAAAVVFWNAGSSELYLHVQRLKELSDSRQYQLWAIIDGKPVDAGVFLPGGRALTAMKATRGDVSMFAVTIEPAGGSQNPTLGTMQVSGKVRKG